MTEHWVHLEPFDITEWFGFVYEIKNKTNGKIYIGKKVFWNNQKKALTKAEIAEQTGPGRKPTHKIVTKESNWKVYRGSNKELLKDIASLGIDNFEKRILKLCKTKKQLTYFEMHYQCIKEVLLKDSYNDNISGKYYRKDFVV
jgi:hypothetical protein